MSVFSTSAAGSNAEPGGRSHWPRLHLIYFLLAAVDILAIAACLYFGHLGLKTFEENLAANSMLERRLVAVRNASDAATDAQAFVISALQDSDISSTRHHYMGKSEELRFELARIANGIAAQLGDAQLKRAQVIIEKLKRGLAAMEIQALAAFDNLQRGDRAAALASISKMQFRYVTLRASIRDLNQFFALVRSSNTAAGFAKVKNLHRLEFAAGALLLLVLLSAASHGYFSSLFMKRRYLELEDANEKLAASHAESLEFAQQIQSVNDDVAALNSQLAANMRRMQEMQQESIRKGRLAQLGELTATVAHELRNPLSTVRTASFLVDRKAKGAGIDIGPQLERIANGITRCDNIITQLLDFSRAGNLNRVTVCLDDCLAKIVAEEARSLPAELSFELLLGLGRTELEIDSGLMARALANLFANASEAMRSKAGSPDDQPRRPPAIAVATRFAGSGIEISVSDNGPGIAPENLDRVSEPLFTTKSFGVGLGLAAAQRILEEHGGKISIQSRPAAGVRITLWLPVKWSSSSNASAAASR